MRLTVPANMLKENDVLYVGNSQVLVLRLWDEEGVVRAALKDESGDVTPVELAPDALVEVKVW